MRLLLVLLCLCATADARPRRARANPELPPPPPVLLAPVDPGPGALSPSPAVPGVQGRASALDLERLATVSRRISMTVDTGVVGLVTPDNQAQVLQHLAADPRWRVAEREGVLAAYERAAVDEQLRGAAHGFQLGEHGAVRVGLRFGGWPEGAAWRTSALVHRVEPSAGALELHAFALEEPAFAGWSASALSVDGAAASLDVYEARSGAEERVFGDVLGVTLGYLQLVVPHASGVATRGYLPFAMPPGEPQSGLPWLELSSAAAGELQVRAGVNPGAAGWTWVRLLNHDLQPWQAAAVGEATRERVGWSERAEELFYLQSGALVPAGAAFSGTAEVWFEPDGGAPERLLALPVQVPARSGPVGSAGAATAEEATP